MVSFRTRSGFEGWSRRAPGALAFGVFIGLAVSSPRAETLQGALARAYASNPDLLAERATVRAVAQNVNIAAAGYRPTVKGIADAGLRYDDPAQIDLGSRTAPRGYGLTVSQPIWDGGRTRGALDQAGWQTEAAADRLKLLEQIVLAEAADIYMGVLRNTAALRLRENHVATLQHLLAHADRRASAGEVTFADPAQVRSALAQAQSDVFAAEAELDASLARYEVLIGKPPGRLDPASAPGRNLPKTEKEAIAMALASHPAIRAAAHGVRAAEAAVQLAQSQLAPTLDVSASVAQRFDNRDYPGGQGRTALVLATLNVPIYQGGAPTAAVNRSKEQLQAASHLLDRERERVRGEARAAFALWRRAAPTYSTVQMQLRSAETALRYVREEADIGTRTTQDVINSIQTLLGARIALINVQRDRVTSAYGLMRATGVLDPARVDVVLVSK